MEVFGVGLPELALILVVILLVFGPDQLPEIAKKLGQATRDLRRSLNDINTEVNEIKKPIDELKQITSFAATDTNAPSNLIVADDSDLPPAALAAKENATPAPPEPDVTAPAEPPTAAIESGPGDEDMSTPM